MTTCRYIDPVRIIPTILSQKVEASTILYGAENDDEHRRRKKFVLSQKSSSHSSIAVPNVIRKVRTEKRLILGVKRAIWND